MPVNETVFSQLIMLRALQLGAEAKTSELREVCLLAIPTVFDLMATVLMNIGLLSVTASVYQMMRGAEMLFAAAFSVIFLHRVLNRKHVGGILCCVVRSQTPSPPPPPPPFPPLSACVPIHDLCMQSVLFGLSSYSPAD